MRHVIAAAALGLFCAATPASAEPVSTFIGLTALLAPVFGTFAGAVGGFIVSSTISVGISYLRSAFTKKPQQQPVAAATGVSGSVQSGGIVPRSFVVGRYLCEPSLTYHNYFGAAGNTPNAYYTQEWLLQDLPAAGIAEIWVDGRMVTWDPEATPGADGIAIPEYNAGGADHLWVRFFDGTQTEADARLVALFSADANRPYAANRIGTGCAKAVITALVNPELFTGFPSVKIVLDGVALYDRREDDTAGGDGDQRFDDAATHAFSANPIVIGENIVRGVRYDDEWVYGGQTVTAAQVRGSAAVAAMNECDTAVDLDEGGTEPQFSAGALVRFSDAPIDVLKEVLKGCNGKCAEIGGVYKFRAGAAAASVLSFSDPDIMASEQRGYDPFPPLDRTINHVQPRYVEPAEAWAVKDAPAFADADLETADGGRRNSVGVTYATVASGTQVQRLARAELLDQRAFRRHAHTMPPEAQVLEPLDVVAWTSTSNGYSAKTFDVLTCNDRGDTFVDVGIKELDPNAYDWTPATHEQPITVGPLAIVRPAAQPIIAPDFDGVTLVGADGRERAGAKLTWDPAVTDVDGIIYEIRRASDMVVVLTDQTDFWDRGELVTTANIVGGTNYEGRMKYRPASPRTSTFSGWIAFTTPDVRVTQGELEARLQQRINAISPLEHQVVQFSTDIQRVAVAAAAASVTAMREVGRIEGHFTRIVRETREYVDTLGTVALAEELSILEARIGEAVASVTELVQAISTLEGQAAGIISQIEALSGDTTAMLQSLRAAGIGELGRFVEQAAVAAATASLMASRNFSSVAADIDRIRASVRDNVAEIIQITEVLASEDEALALSIIQLSATTTDADTQLQSRATALEQLTAHSSHGNVALANALTSLTSAVAGKASTSALNALQTTVDAQGDDITALSTETTELDARLDTAETNITNRSRVFAQTSAPTASATNDLWFDTDDGNKPYRWNGSAWVEATDLNRNRIFVQNDAPTATTTNDLWIDANDNNRLYRWNGSAWAEVTDPRIAANASAVTSIQAQVTSNDGDISALAGTFTRLFANNGLGESAEGFIRFMVADDASGAVGTLAIEINVGTYGTPDWKRTGIYMDAISALSRIRLLADQLRIATSPTAAGDLVFESGTRPDGSTGTILRSLFVGALSVDTIQIKGGAISVASAFVQDVPVSQSFYTRTITLSARSPAGSKLVVMMLGHWSLTVTSAFETNGDARIKINGQEVDFSRWKTVASADPVTTEGRVQGGHEITATGSPQNITVTVEIFGQRSFQVNSGLERTAFQAVVFQR